MIGNLPEIPEKYMDIMLMFGKAAVILLVGFIIIKLILRFIRRALEKSTLDPVLYKFILNIVRIVTYVVLLLMILDTFHLKVTSFLTILGAAGAAIALALKDSLANVAGGIMILINKPFNKDDYIDIGGISGKVQEIDLFITHLITYDNKVITIPNGLVNTSVLVNHTRESLRRVDCCFGIGYDDNIEKAKEILREIAAGNRDIHMEPEPVIGVAGQKDNCISIDLKVWCETEVYWDVKYFLEEQVKLAFDKAGISIPFPQMDVHIKEQVKSGGLTQDGKKKYEKQKGDSEYGKQKI